MAGADGETKLLIITVNEGERQVAPDDQLRAVQATLADHNDISAVVMAEQESTEAGRWDSTMSSCGFSEKIVDARICTGVLISLCVYSRKGISDGIRLIDTYSTGSINIEKKKKHCKGGIVALLHFHGIKICLGGFHIDGNIASCTERISQLPAAVLRSQCRGGADVALLVGDMNCTLDPEKSMHGDRGSLTPTAKCAQLLAADIVRLRETGEGNRLMELSADTKETLQIALTTSESRGALMQAIDGMPNRIGVELSALTCDELWDREKEPEEVMSQCGITELLLQEMPAGSFPTYRISGTGISRMDPHLDVTRATIQECYFADEKAGVLKKRGDMIRMNLGWLDRMYYGFNTSLGPPSIDMHIEQGIPLALGSAETSALDHAFVPWIVTIRASSSISCAKDGLAKPEPTGLASGCWGWLCEARIRIGRWFA